MAWLIGVGVVAFMLAPIIWILPSPRQRRQSLIRDKARQLGLQVRVTPLPQTRRQRVRKESQVQVVSYTRPIHCRQPGAPWRQWLTAVEEEENTLDLLSATPAAVRQHLDELPSGGILLEYTGLGLAFYWQELGAQPDTITALSSALEHIVQAAKLED